ncbi:MAG: redoxin domain-containing protein [Planctomycetales bacterium]|nr:redoxin domain-containing protein [Planctomycetales bacterium]
MSAPTTFRRQFHRAALVALVALSGYLMVFGVSGDGLVDIGSFVSATDAGGSATRRLPTDSHRVQLVAARMQADGQDKPADDATTGGEKPGSDTESNGTATEENDMPQHPFPRRAPAPPLTGGEGWLNTAGPIDLEALRGKFVVLDFWTYCCINCMHILPELKKLELAYPNEVVVIGVHSAKFDTEKGSDNIAEAVQRYEILHPVVNDSQHRIWNNFHITSWPSLRVIDPEGNLVAGASGEIDFETLDGFFQQALPYYRARGLLDETPMHFELESYAAADTPLRYPAKVLADEAGDRLFIADSNHNRIVVTSLAGESRYTIGSGAIGKNDGDFASATFNHPQGMALGDGALYVCDTENHMLRKVDLDAQSVTTIAGTGEQARGPWPGFDVTSSTLPERFVGAPKSTPLNSPWALWIQGDVLYIAMAGPHQIWSMPLDESEIGPYAGNGREDIVDGKLLPSQPYGPGSSFAQPSGLASDGKQLFVADSEGSSIRAVPFGGEGDVTTIVGTADQPQGRLFIFGDVDGSGDEVRLQHPLGVAWYEGVLYVADTYNSKIKAVDVGAKSVRTVAGPDSPITGAAAGDQLREPTGLSAASGRIYVADTNSHAIRVIDLASGELSTLDIAGLTSPTVSDAPAPSLPHPIPVEVSKAKVRPGAGGLAVRLTFHLPRGFVLNDEAPLSYTVDAAADQGPVDRSSLGESHDVAAKSLALSPLTAQSPSLDITIPLAATSGDDDLTIAATVYYCMKGSEGVCKVASPVWTVPVNLADDGAETVELTVELP